MAALLVANARRETVVLVADGVDPLRFYLSTTIEMLSESVLDSNIGHRVRTTHFYQYSYGRIGARLVVVGYKVPVLASPEPAPDPACCFPRTYCAVSRVCESNINC